MLSIIITYHQEGPAFIGELINQIRSTIDVEPYEIIVVDDNSKIPLSPIPGVKIIRHATQLGVGAGFDTGVAVAQYENLILTACDIRIVQKDWASMMVKELDTHTKSLNCVSCVCLNAEKPENLDIEKRKKISVTNGANIIFFHDKKSNPKMTPTFRGIIEAQWYPSLKNKDVPSSEIPCILGAFYGVKKEWYNYIDGFWGHKLWGTLEPYISLKSWLLGGSCRVIPRIYAGHIFKRAGTHGTPQDALMYNKMMVVTLLFPDHGRLIAFLGSNPIVERARKMYQAELPLILKKKEEYAKKTVYSIEEYVKRWKIDYRH